MTTKQRRRAPGHQQHKADQRDGEIGRRPHRRGPHRVVERGAEHTDHRGIDAAHRRLRAGAIAQRVPERQHPDENEDPGKEDADQRQRRPGEAVGRQSDHGAQIGGEGEERSRHRLRSAVAGKKGIIADPAGRHDGLPQQRQHDMAAAEHQRAGAIERGEQAAAACGR